MIRIKNLIALFIILYSLFLPINIEAIESSPSANVKAKLDELKAEIASKASKLKQEINRKLQNKVYTGIIKSKSSSSITLAYKEGTRLVSINQDTIFEDDNPPKKGAKKVTPGINTLKEEVNIAALGDVDDTGVLHAKRIVILEPPIPNPQPPTYLWGQIVSESDDLITVKTKDGKNAAVSVVDIKNKYKPDDFVIITGTAGKNEILEASFLYVIPKGATLKFKEATPSATPKVTPKPITKPK